MTCPRSSRSAVSRLMYRSRQTVCRALSLHALTHKSAAEDPRGRMNVHYQAIAQLVGIYIDSTSQFLNLVGAEVREPVRPGPVVASSFC